VEDARDQGRGVVEEAQVRFEVVVVGSGGWGRGPQDGVVIGEEGEDDAEEEADRCFFGLLDRLLCEVCSWGGDQEGGLRHTIRKVAKDPFLKAMITCDGGCAGEDY
jgi:hypothetical protein